MSQKPNNIYLLYSESRTGGEPEEPEERWTSYTPQYITFSPERLVIKEQSFQETIQVDWTPEVGKQVWLVVVRYQTGSTFGTSHGCWTIVDAYQSEPEATTIAQIINDHPKNYADLQKAMAPYVKDFYACWIGYFERLEGVEIHQMALEEDDFQSLKSKNIIYKKH